MVNKLLQMIDQPTFIKNNKGVYIGCNQAFEQFLGLTRNQILGSTAFDIAPASLAKTYAEADIVLFSKGATQIYKAPVTNMLRQQETVIFSKTIFCDEGDKVAGFIGTINFLRGHAINAGHNMAKQAEVKLTKREFEVLFLMSQGLAAKEISRSLAVSSHTVVDYMKSLFHKLGVSNRVSAILVAQKLGLI